MIEEPIPGFGKNARPASECALQLIISSDEVDKFFTDNGSAIAWAMNN